MKRKFELIGIMLLIGIFALSCKEEEPVPDDVTPVVNYKNYVQVDGTKTEMDTLYDVYYKDYWNDYYHTYLLVEKETYYNSFMSSILGRSDGFSFEVETANSNYLPDGEYFLDSTNAMPAQGEIRNALYYVDYDFFMGDGESVKMKSGSCKITSIGTSNKYKIEGTFLGKDGKEYTFHYDGTVTKARMDHEM